MKTWLVNWFHANRKAIFGGLGAAVSLLLADTDFFTHAPVGGQWWAILAALLGGFGITWVAPANRTKKPPIE